MGTPDAGIPRRIARATMKDAPDDAQRFTGEVVVQRLGEVGVKLLRVSFRAGARTAVHRHDTEQWLYFLDGHGFVQHLDADGNEMDKPIVAEVRDCVVTPPGIWHHHGALAGHDTVHLSITCAVTDYDDNWQRGRFLPPIRPHIR
jgi:quercetin dioxygenase-like cupin family protein